MYLTIKLVSELIISEGTIIQGISMSTDME